MTQSTWYRGRDGGERLWLTEADIEALIEEELHRAHLMPNLNEPVVNLERFVEGYLSARLEQYAELEPTVLGQTEFCAGRAPLIRINRSLTGAAADNDDCAPGVFGRWRATMAHEAAHVLLHRVLFELHSAQDDLVGDASGFNRPRGLERLLMPPSLHLLRCDTQSVLFRGGGRDWREVQANRGMAALLMPRIVVRAVAGRVIGALGLAPRELTAESPGARKLVTEVATRMKVSKQAASIRLETLAIVAPAGHAGLVFDGQ